jgi:hypothetical protein
MKRRDSDVGIMTTLRAGLWRKRASIPVRSRYFSRLQNGQMKCRHVKLSLIILRHLKIVK